AEDGIRDRNVTGVQTCALPIYATMNGLLGELNDQTIEAGHELICVCSDGPKIETMRERGYDVRPIHIDRSIKPISNFKSIWKMRSEERRVEKEKIEGWGQDRRQ